MHSNHSNVRSCAPKCLFAPNPHKKLVGYVPNVSSAYLPPSQDNLSPLRSKSWTSQSNASYHGCHFLWLISALVSIRSTKLLYTWPGYYTWMVYRLLTQCYLPPDIGERTLL